jgi:aspartate-semialdehyde dehydrogenase
MKQEIKLALVGASGVVGRKILKILEEKNIRFKKLYLLGNSTVGEVLKFNNQDLIIQSLDDFDSTNADVVILAAGSLVAKAHARAMVDKGSYVIDLSSEYRYEDDIPLIIPEINGQIVDQLDSPTIIANPNCSTSQLLMALKPIHDDFGIDFINIATYQAVSGTGKAAVEELKYQVSSKDLSPKIYPKQIAFNVIPQCDVFLENSFTKEEMKLVWETKKILDEKIEIQATCVRVPVINGHSEAVFLKLQKNASKEDILKSLKKMPGICIVDNIKNLEYPTPAEYANDTEEVFVGRVRCQNINNETWTSLWIVADNVYGKGAALNAIQILERLLSEKL